MAGLSQWAKEDVIFCGRRRIEYHMNMVGAEILNLAFRDHYSRCTKKAVFLPACLRVRAERDCRATAAGPGFTCTACTPECHIARIAKLGKEHHFAVIIIPHESSLTLSGPMRHLGFLRL